MRVDASAVIKRLPLQGYFRAKARVIGTTGSLSVAMAAQSHPGASTGENDMTVTTNEHVTVEEAAELLRVSVSTIRRWIRTGNVPAYRIGSRRLLLKRDELFASMQPVHRKDWEVADSEPEAIDLESLIVRSPEDRFVDRRLTPEEQKHAIAAFGRAKEHSDRILASRGGKPFPSSSNLINDARDELSRRPDNDN